MLKVELLTINPATSTAEYKVTDGFGISEVRQAKLKLDGDTTLLHIRRMVSTEAEKLDMQGGLW